MGDEFLRSVCLQKACGWNAFSGRIGCSSGDGSCLVTDFITADDSDFYTPELREATEQIQEIVASIKAKDDRKLGLVNTPFGVLLAWVEHDIEIPSDPVTFNSPPEKIIAALGLTGVKPSDAKGA